MTGVLETKRFNNECTKCWGFRWIPQIQHFVFIRLSHQELEDIRLSHQEIWSPPDNLRNKRDVEPLFSFTMTSLQKNFGLKTWWCYHFIISW